MANSKELLNLMANCNKDQRKTIQEQAQRIKELEAEIKSARSWAKDTMGR